MGELNYFIGLQIKKLKHGTFLCQPKYCKELLKKFEMERCKEVATLISTNYYLDVDKKGLSMDQTKYKRLIGSLLYLTAIKPDIKFNVCLCARYQSNPKESHYSVAKRIMKYLKRTIDVGLWYPSEVSLNLVGYSDFDFVRCKLDRKSTSGTYHLLGSILILWNNKM